tara:strand:- start:92 stop:310 length:219 start_codon:yes stop_codon:yes gene_type:complete
MDDLTKEQRQELEKLATEIEAEAIQMKVDYEQNPSEDGGSIVVIHENSEFLESKERSIRMVEGNEKHFREED